jgi:hypothetical protein
MISFLPLVIELDDLFARLVRDLRKEGARVRGRQAGRQGDMFLNQMEILSIESDAGFKDCNIIGGPFL